jgi:hypothetical protein
MSSNLVVDRSEAAPSPAWRAWLWVFLGTTLILFPVLYVTVLVVDPFSTGRFALTQRIDFTTRNIRMGRAGLVRDPQFNGIIVGSSSGLAIDPVRATAGTDWKLAQLAIPGALPPDQLTVARAFERRHLTGRTLFIFVLDSLWCRSGKPEAEPFGPFPAWLYESTDMEYLRRILSPAAVEAAAKRVSIWLNLAPQAARVDGYAPVFPRVKGDTMRAALSALQPESGGPSPDEPYPALDLLTEHLAALPAEASVLLMFAPVYINALPLPGSRADARLAACKEAVRRLAERRAGTSYLDLRTDNAMTRMLDDFHSAAHYGPKIASMVGDRIAVILRDMRSR